VAIVALVGIIDKPSFAVDAHVCKGTTTFKKISEVYHLGEVVINKVIQDLAIDKAVHESTSENLLCEYPRDCIPGQPFDSNEYCSTIAGRGLARPDVFFAGQRIFSVVPGTNTGKATLKVIQTGKDGQDKSIGILTLPTLQRCWLLKRSATNDVEVKVSRESRLRNTIPKLPARKKRKKLLNTGLGVHHQLEENLHEKDNLLHTSVQEEIDERLDPSFALYMGNRMQRFQIMASNSRTTRNGPPSLALVYNACREDGTYRYIEPQSLCLSLLTSNRAMPKKLARKKVSRYFVQHSETVRDGMQIWTCQIDGERQSSLKSVNSSTALLDNGLACFHKNTAFYKTKAQALKSVIIRTLVEVATDWEDAFYDPKWAREVLPENTTFAVIYENGGVLGGHGDKIFGVLQFKGGHRVLSVPRDEDDLTRPWQEFTFADFGHSNRYNFFQEKQARKPGSLVEDFCWVNGPNFL
jgi:hypothetical protein